MSTAFRTESETQAKSFQTLTSLPPSLSLSVPLLPLVHAVKVPESSVSCHSPSEMPHSIDVC